MRPETHRRSTYTQSRKWIIFLSRRMPPSKIESILPRNTLVRIVVIDRQRRGAGEPENFPALDLDARHERHEHRRVVVRMMDDLSFRPATQGLMQSRPNVVLSCQPPKRCATRHDTYLNRGLRKVRFTPLVPIIPKILQLLSEGIQFVGEKLVQLL